MAFRALEPACASELPFQSNCSAACGEPDARQQLIQTLGVQADQRRGPFTPKANPEQSGAEPG